MRKRGKSEINRSLLWLYSSLGKKENIVEAISRFIVKYMPLLRAIINLFGKESPVKRSEVIKDFSLISSIQSEPLVRHFF